MDLSKQLAGGRRAFSITPRLPVSRLRGPEWWVGVGALRGLSDLQGFQHPYVPSGAETDESFVVPCTTILQGRNKQKNNLFSLVFREYNKQPPCHVLDKSSNFAII